MSGESPLSARAAFRRFWPYVRVDRRFLVFATLLLMIGAAAETVAIWTFGSITDDALAKASLAGFWLPAGIWVGMAVAGGLASFGAGWLTAVVAERFLLRLRDDVYAHLQRLSPDFFAAHDTGDLVARLTSDVEMVEQLAASGVVWAVSAVVTIVFFAAAATVLCWQLAVAAFLLTPVFWLAARAFGGRIRAVSADERDLNGAITAAVGESLTNLTLVQAYNQQRADLNRLHAHGRSWLRARIREARLAGTYPPLVDVAEITCLLLVIGAGIWEVGHGRLTVGGVLAFTAYLGYLYPPLRQLGQLTITANAAAAGASRIVELLDARPAVVDGPRARPLRRVRGDVRFDHVGYAYPGATRPAVHDVSFTASPGQLVLVTGMSGAGKSTIANLLLRFADPATGRVRLDGVDLRHTTVASLREHVTLVSQRTRLFRGTVADNIAFGRPDATPAQITAAATMADAHEFVTALPEGYRTVLDGDRLSGGQRQRLAIARALLRDTPVLVLDEPTAGLDAPATQRVIEPLRRLAGGRTTILISHDLSLAPLADHILVLEGGRLVEQGRHADLVRAGGPYARLRPGTRQPEPARPPAVPVRAVPVTRPRLTPIHLHGTDTSNWLLRGNLRA